MDLVSVRVEVDRGERPVEQGSLLGHAPAEGCFAIEFGHGCPVRGDEEVGVGAYGIDYGDERERGSGVLHPCLKLAMVGMSVLTGGLF